MKGPVVAFDLGAKRIGAAVSDAEGRFAFARETLERSGDSWPWKRILELIRASEATQVVVGDPRHMDGRSGDRSRLSQEFARELAERTGLPVHLEDERLTSVQAERALREGGGARRKGDVDRSAAILILQAWLDRHAGDAAGR